MTDDFEADVVPPSKSAPQVATESAPDSAPLQGIEIDAHSSLEPGGEAVADPKAAQAPESDRGVVVALREIGGALRDFKLAAPVAFILILAASNIALQFFGNPTAFFLCLLIDAVIGWAVVARLLWPWVERAQPGGSKWIIGAAVAAVLYVVRVKTLSDVNGVFGVDPAALPLTTAAAFVFRICRQLALVLILSGVLGVVSLLLLIHQSTSLKSVTCISKVFDTLNGKPHPEEVLERALLVTERAGAMLVMLFLSFTVFALLHFRLPSDSSAGTIFRLGTATDFSDQFDCQGFPSDQYRALFLGPEQRRALFIRKPLPSPTRTDSASDPLGEVFSGAELPGDLQIQVSECIPGPAHSLDWKRPPKPVAVDAGTGAVRPTLGGQRAAPQVASAPASQTAALGGAGNGRAAPRLGLEPQRGKSESRSRPASNLLDGSPRTPAVATGPNAPSSSASASASAVLP